MSQNPWPSTTALHRKEKSKLKPDMQTRRVAKEIHQPLWQQQKPDSDGYLSISPLPATEQQGLDSTRRGEWIRPFGAERRLRTSEHSWVDFHCPTVKSCSFSTLYLHLIFKQPCCLSLISPLPPQPYPIFHPKRKRHKAMILLAATTLLIFLACCDISFGACLDYLHFILPCFTLLTIGLWPLECYPNK